VAEEQPLICLADDAQWLDRASTQVLAFVARRLEVESVGLVFAARTPSGELAACRSWRSKFEPGRCARLLNALLTGPLDARVGEQIVSETRGNRWPPGAAPRVDAC